QELVATVLHPKIELKTMHSRAILKNTIPLSSAVEQWGNLGAFISALYTNDYELLSRSMIDKVVEPYRALLIPKFNEVKSAALGAGALGSGISGSGPSIYALSRGLETAQKVGLAMQNELKNLDLDFEVHISKINEQGVKILY
ncbi:MAG: homoserine kinase, partial [Flavobacteriaceae bacterium]